jgi:hypothetical protein
LKATEIKVQNGTDYRQANVKSWNFNWLQESARFVTGAKTKNTKSAPEVIAGSSPNFIIGTS